MVRTTRRLTRTTATVTAAALTALSVGVAAGAAVAAVNDPPATSSNPGLQARCGLDIGLVLDGSGSIGSANAVSQVQAAARALLEPLRNTNTNAGIVTFATGMKASATVPLQPLTTASYSAPTTGFDAQISNYGSSGTTNWDLALRTAQQNFIGAGVSADRPTVPNLLVFITDGAPNRFGGATKTIGAGDFTSTSGTSAQLAEAADAAVFPAITDANAIKATGTRMLTIGVGQALTSSNRSTFIETLRKVTAPVQANVVANSGVIPSGISSNYNVQSSYNPSTTDMILVTDFSQLSSELAKVASTLCSGSLTINKLASTPQAPDTYAPASGWDFKATPSAQNASYSWVLPSASTGDTNQTGTTDGSGKTTFQWDVLGADGRADWNANKGIAIKETVKNSFTLDSIVCKNSDGGSVTPTGVDKATGAFTVPVGVLDIVTCDVKNKAQAPVTVTVAKKAAGDTFYDDGTTTDFPLVVSGPAVPGTPKTLSTKAGASSNVTLSSFQGATTAVTVSEASTPANWALTSITCKVNNQSVSDGSAGTTGFQLTLKPGDAVSCEVTNTVTAPAATVTVTKKWIIDGTEYTNSNLPSGFSPAVLTLTGDNAPASPQFGTTYTGFKATKTVTVGETLGTLPQGCVNTPSGDLGTQPLKAGANSFQITNTVVCDAAIKVTKTWVIDGTTYANGQQPDGFSASLNLSPRKADGGFGAVVGGYKVNDKVVVGESTQVPEGCTIQSSGLGEKTLSLRGVNEFTVTNTVRCPATVTVDKVWVVDGVTYKVNAVPAGFGASATVDGKAATWGTPVTGFHLGQTVPVGETDVTVPADCRMVGEASIDGPDTLAIGANTFTITNTAVCAATVTVTKVWVVNGTTYADGQQPAGLSASLTLDGGARSFGTEKTGYKTGDAVVIGETADLAECVAADDASGLGTVTLARGANNYTVTNYVTCRGDLRIEKTDADTGSAVTGGTFALYAADVEGDPVGSPLGSCTITSGNSCTLTGIGLGTYVWVETAAPTGYQLPADTVSDPVSVTTASAGTTQTRSFADPQKRTSIVVTKIDAQDKSALGGAEFTLWRDGGDGAFGGDDTQVSIPPQVTGPNGTTTFSGLLFGTYFVEESAPPLGYTKATPSVQKVVVSAASAGQQVSLTFANPRKATTIVVTKIDKDLADADVLRPLENFTFELRDSEGEYVDECITAASGECTFEDVDFGSYTVVETGQADGYQADAPSQTVTVSADNAGVVKGLTFENSQKRTSLTVRKTSAVDASLLDGAEFGLYAVDLEGDPVGDPVDTCITGDEGECTVDGLLFGTYVWVELTAPTGYEKSSATTSDPITIDEDTAGTTFEVVTFTNPQKLTTLTVVKVDAESGDRLEGAVFSLYLVVEGETVGEPVGTCTTGDDGTCTVGGLAFGTYRWVETQAPEGYAFPPVATSGDVTVDATNAGTAVPATIVGDEKIRTGVTVEKTGNRAPGFLGPDDFFSVVESVRGATTTFRFEVTNTGNTPLEEVVLDDTLWLGTTPSVVDPASPVDESDLSCYVGSANTPPADKSDVFTLGSPIAGLTVAPGATAWLYCDLPIPTSLTDAQITDSFIYDKAVITGTPQGTEDPITDDTQVVAVKVFPQAYDIYPVKTIVDADGTNPRSFEDLGRIDTPQVLTFRMFIDNVSETDQQVTLYDYFTDWTGLTAQQRTDLFDSMRCIDYDNPDAFVDGFPQNFYAAPDSGLTAEVFSDNGLATDTTFGTADNAVSGGTKTDGTFYARSMSFVQEAGGGFEIACQLLLPVGDYEFTNVFRLVATPDLREDQFELSSQRFSGARPTAATLAVPAASGDLDLVAEAGVRAGTPVDEGSPTPTPTDTPTTIPSTGGDPLPQTGGSAGALLGWGLLLVVAGVLMTVAARRRDNGARHVG